jgi:signal transduction histidine kinase
MFSVNPKKLLRNSAFRLALVYVALFGTSALALLGFVYWSTAQYMLRQSDQTIEAEIRGMAERYRLTGLTGLTALIHERTGRQPSGSSIYLLTDSFFSPLAGNLNRWPQVEPDSEGWINFQLGAGGSGPIHWARAKRFRLRGDFLLLVGRDMYELEAMRSQIARTVGWGSALTIGLAFVGGALMSRGRIRRIGVIHRAIGEVIDGDLSRRIPTDPTGDDIEELVGKLNRMLDELEKLVEGVRRVSDNIAHDLRTPLTRLRNHLESLGLPGTDDHQRRHLVERAIGEADGLLSTFNALLRIARIESGQHRSALVAVELDSLVEDVAELYEPLTEEAKLDLKVTAEPRVIVPADRDLLFQALANLVDNAVKHSPPGGHITLTLGETNEEAHIEVTDEGPGIPPSERQQVFQRFYRLDSSRNTPGAGLGLSLVSAVAELHHARIRLESNEPGLRVIMTLKKHAD